MWMVIRYVATVDWVFVRTRQLRAFAMTILPLMNQDSRAKTILPLAPSPLPPSSLTIWKHEFGGKCSRVRVETRIGETRIGETRIGEKSLRRSRLEIDWIRKLVFGISIGTQSTVIVKKKNPGSFVCINIQNTLP